MNWPWRCPLVPLIGTTVPNPLVNWPSAFVCGAAVKPVVVGLGRINRFEGILPFHPDLQADALLQAKGPAEVHVFRGMTKAPVIA